MSFVSTKLGLKLLAPPYPQAITGLDLASEAYLLTELVRTQPKKAFIRITPDLKSGLTLKQNLEFFLGEAEENKIVWFPSHDTLPYTGLVAGTDTMAERLSALKKLFDEDYSILIAPWQAILRKVIPSEVFKNHQRTIYVGEEIKREEFTSWLVATGYSQEVLAESAGDFAVRGALIDIYPPHEENPVRLEFEGDRLIGIRYFDAATQTSLKKTKDLRQVTLIPASEILLMDELCKNALKKIKQFSDELDAPSNIRKEALEKIESKRSFVGFETFLPAFYEKSATLLDYIKPEAIIFSPDQEELKEIFEKVKLELENLHQTTKNVERLIPPATLLNSYSNLEAKLKSFPQIWVNPLLKLEQADISVHQVHLENSAQLKAKWKPEQLKVWRSQGFQTRLVCHTPIQAERLQDMLRAQEVSFSEIEIGKLSHGFGWPDEGLIVLTEEEIFGHKTIRKTKSTKAAASFTSFSELKTGDYLVHEEHGIACYAGLKHIKIRGINGDFLQLEFLGNDKLYLPIYRLNAVQRYVGGSTEVPFLDKLGGLRWKKIKERAHQVVYKIAQELLKIHAQRELNPGFSYPALDTLDEEFASHFPFDETPDQAQAIEDVLRDMQNPKPMDRLICGDVGYGKTEVAMRAAFKVVNSGKQVAVLVPTTVLALQHFETFQERFSKLAISVEMLSRFRSRAEQKEILAKLAEGKLDIVIGTHRLLMEDTKFRQLGLLIIDEEHRFGVRHKEKIKKLRPTVDVLTLSATPIPRTLHMSLIGLRDLSMIHTPPVDRIAIRTFIAKWDDAVVRHAVHQELARGGQVFFVHNRVATIESMHKRLLHLFPDTKISVAHGQMKEDNLEKVMIDFLHQKTQILLTTTIIESGIDVPTANTMIINRADAFGLAQIYQLRGRVGRSDRQAYCYLLVPDEETITKDAKQRLSALTRYTELGAGFQIASHDLEIRGGGNLLGTSQAGFIEEIGYELYTKLLAQTIRRLKGEKIEEEIDPEINLKIAAFIPESYVADTTLRMGLYKRMSHLSTVEEIKNFEQEIIDRFGPFPEEVKNLLGIIEVKQLAIRLRLRSIQFDGGNFILNWDPSTPVNPKALIELAASKPSQYQLKQSGVLFIKQAPFKHPEEVLLAAKMVLSSFLTYVSSQRQHEP
ncbi:MAG: transcription-repair coupling factor [Deltaproteobacteria bacterium RIFCSPLOWO2_01_44_7]|nr:MAG: transcription-repair coupling factor [Deltaproteobacteria bacterium RIFCSPHIGHO2_01_FULL_43_49]OGQ14582.1 MAG: transcription-repair coupling factor [Deltaproteobacteria bacterium RIFCSPHIGHO2_02_FULL_44_53]OGQ27968.1 MAG: transcription-repair coupling factor [Deltaproteobacteria bacterium RIFCSPHIGHO2_12_FULL_44_21]OGQ31180.1 MAG: transcription-repair coupling factor [Deltaproteobacteria bacterium RIFCSPLOWO2_01_FULL_45_74]OGQ38779.1 MAG: transcription-repair coupling factor [Deltaprote